jgi:hypothetical protein
MRHSLNNNEQSLIEEEFLKSWEWTEEFYASLGAYYEQIQKSMLRLIGEMRERGYSRKLRAGIQLFDFILSRARINGLRLGQATLRFTPKLDGSITIQYKGSDGSSTLNLVHGEFTSEFELLLERLVAHSID